MDEVNDPVRVDGAIVSVAVSTGAAGRPVVELSGELDISSVEVVRSAVDALLGNDSSGSGDSPGGGSSSGDSPGGSSSGDRSARADATAGDGGVGYEAGGDGDRRADTEGVGAGQPGLIFDLSRLDFVDSSGIAFFLQMVNRAGSVELHHAKPAVRRVLEVTGLLQVLQVGES